MDAQRYLISQVDTHRMARIRKASAPPDPGQSAPPDSTVPPKPKRKWLSRYNEALWTRLY
jgi:hypothetical protein